MKISGLVLLSLSMVITNAMNAQTSTPAEAFQIVTEWYREILLRKPSADTQKLNSYITTSGLNGRWPDVDYEDKLLAGWKTAEHLDRVHALSLALVSPRSPLHDDKRVEATVFRALDHWIEKRYKNPNWWHNEIGVPLMIRDIVVLSQ
jgi:chondroitin AC lyase